MSINRHVVTVDVEQLASVMTGHVVQVMTDKDLAVQLVRDDLYDQTPGANGVQVIPVGAGLISDLEQHGHTGWVPFHNPYVFGIYLKN